MQKELGLAGRVGCTMIAVAVLLLPIPLLFGKIGVDVFLAVETIWLLVAGGLVFGTDTISKISFGQASIERKLKATELALDEAEAIRDEMRDIARAVVENNYLLSCVTPLAGVTAAPTMRFNSNMNKLSKFAEPDPNKELSWLEDTRGLFGHAPR
ncbi:hypothetical protein JFU47_27665 [Pseudomonas sp. TH39(2020)]|uniref:hypothetical protein n=1 Tax=Pseudomonas sp. TH39(2020) TaxID=2796349 RepID=UPI001911A219|nr:hypothetical protein [Pseudomonas sp. TH39(2020)]MBK5400451.1 hypothetical protein [Pseudomonas sp. TH39(2020)]